MDHGPRVASIEAVLGGDMTPGRHARWQRLDLDPPDTPETPDGSDPGMELEDARFRAAVDEVVPADTPQRDALIERAVDVARARFLADGETTWPEQALDLAAHQDRTQPEHGHDGQAPPVRAGQPTQEPSPEPEPVDQSAPEQSVQELEVQGVERVEVEEPEP